MTDEGISIAARIDALADELIAREEMGEEWRAAMHAAPRHLFVPPVAWSGPYDRPGHVIDHEADAAGWLKAAYADHPIVTQIDDGETDVREGEGRVYSSSLSAPGAVMSFLDLLAPYPGDKVLEVGTGTGWTAALLSHRVGAGNVTSIEMDEVLLSTAAENLERAGHDPRLVRGDGLLGFADGAPYDRVHVTCGVYEIPYAWVEQTRPGGVIVLPWSPPFEPGHNIALTVTAKGTAIGGFSGGSSYMMARNQRHPDKPQVEPGRWRLSETDVDPRRVMRGGFGADVVIATLVPEAWSESEFGEESMTVQLWDRTSLAVVAGREVRQYGERNLWDEVEAAFFKWVEWGCPGRNRFGMTVTRDGRHVWLDSPDSPIG
ncbi:methyltransferase domain-containing protein [Sphaerisporangium sp. NPDC051017]|uniref:methyltransferase domain-containing protein n=1 Tax=Sphaerisporangium sp. NPDC051017 TaxID=3154636 RepID=UPI00341716D7